MTKKSNEKEIKVVNKDLVNKNKKTTNNVSKNKKMKKSSNVKKPLSISKKDNDMSKEPVNVKENMKKDKFSFFKEKEKVKKKKKVNSKKKRKSKKGKGKKFWQRNNFDGKFRVDILDILILIIVTAIISCVITGVVLNSQFKKFNSLYGSTDDENAQEFLSVYREVVDNYYEDVDAKAMVEAGIEGMMNFLEDNYSIYLDKNDTSDLSNMLDSSYTGVGIVSMTNIVYKVYDNSPASNAGIKENDIIIKVNGIDVDESNYEIISQSISEHEGENEIVVKRGEEELTYYVAKGEVSIPVTQSNVVANGNKKTGYLQLSSFSTSSFDEFEQALLDLEKENIDNLVIDLRDNTGGYLTSAKNIANLFLEKDKLIYSLQDRNETVDVLDDTDDEREYSIVVLVNSRTASAAEILAAALHDSYGALLVGNKTYGKGKVQNMKYYEDTMIKYTSAKWLRPNGECVDEVGIEPDYEVSLEIENSVVYDKQLDKALELLR